MVYSSRRRSGKRRPKLDRHRALELLADSPDGTTDTLLMDEHGLTTEMLVELIRDGLAIGQTERLVIAGHTTEVVRVRISEAGRQALRKASRGRGSARSSSAAASGIVWRRRKRLATSAE